MKFAKRTFTAAGVIGALTILPMYLLPAQPMFYAAMAAILAWQPVFFLIGSDPIRYRQLMLPAVIEKWGWVLTLAISFARGRVTLQEVIMFTPFSLILGSFFLAARLRLDRERP